MLSVLIATSKLYETAQVMHWLLPLLVLTLGLVVLAIYLVHRSILRLWHYDRVVSTKARRAVVPGGVSGDVGSARWVR